MEFRGWHSVEQFEQECKKHGYKTWRVPFFKGNDKFFAVINRDPHPSPTSIDTFDFFTADGKQYLHDGIMRGDSDNPENFRVTGFGEGITKSLQELGYQMEIASA